jgi:endonuclease YncB( thermonuclease family)
MKSRLLFLFFVSTTSIFSGSVTADVIHSEWGNPANNMSMLLFSNEDIAYSFDKKSYGDVTVSEVTRIDDAISFYVNIEGYPPIIGRQVAVRISGVDAPEIESNCKSEKDKAIEAKQFTADSLSAAKTVELRNIERGVYFRILAEVYVDGKNLAENLIQSGHARASDNGDHTGWCDAQ